MFISSFEALIRIGKLAVTVINFTNGFDFTIILKNKDKNEISIIQDTKEHVNQDTTKKRKIVTLTGFEGIFVNSYEIDVNNRIKEFFKKYGLIYETSITILYESFLNKKENFSNMRLKIEDAGLIIKKLYGNNGIIDENEYKRVNLSDNEVKKRY